MDTSAKTPPATLGTLLNLAGARRYGWYGLLVALGTLVLSLVAQPFVEPVLSLLSYADEVRTMMGAYIRIRLLSAGAAIGIEALANYYCRPSGWRAQARSSWARPSARARRTRCPAW